MSYELTDATPPSDDALAEAGRRIAAAPKIVVPPCVAAVHHLTGVIAPTQP